jgi:hypothetical protein
MELIHYRAQLRNVIQITQRSLYVDDRSNALVNDKATGIR